MIINLFYYIFYIYLKISIISKMNFEANKYLKFNHQNNDIDIDKKNSILKEQLKSLDFSQVEILYQKIKYISENINSKVKFQQSLLNLKKEMDENLFNIKGEIYSIKRGADNNKDYFSRITKELFLKLYIKIKNKDNLYNICIRKVTDQLKNNFVKLQKNSFLIFTNLRPNLEINSNEYSLIFSPTLDTKIYLQMKKLVDSGYEINVDIAKNNEFDFIRAVDSNGISKIISIFPSEYFDFEILLQCYLKNSIIPINHNYNNDIEKEVTICGIINKIIIKDSNMVLIEVSSLIDLNIITVIIYNNKSLYIDLKENMLVFFKNYIIKLNKNCEIILKNCIRSNNEYIYLIKNEEIIRYNRNKFKNMSKRNFQSLINLTSNLCCRNLEKYLITIKKIIKIEGYFHQNNNKIQCFSNLKLKGKIIIDDGSYEAMAFIEDYELIKFLDFGTNDLTEIYDILLRENSIIIYDKYVNKLKERNYKHIFSKQFIIYAYSFMKNNKNNNNRLSEYFGEMLDYQFEENNNSKIFNNRDKYLFVNGEIIINKNNKGEYYLEKRPYLKIIQIELIE